MYFFVSLRTAPIGEYGRVYHYTRPERGGPPRLYFVDPLAPLNRSGAADSFAESRRDTFALTEDEFLEAFEGSTLVYDMPHASSVDELDEILARLEACADFEAADALAREIAAAHERPSSQQNATMSDDIQTQIEKVERGIQEVRVRLDRDDAPEVPPSSAAKNQIQFVVKRDGSKEPFDEQKIVRRIEKLANGLDKIDKADVFTKIRRGLIDGMTVAQIDEFSAETCAALNTKHPNYGILAGRFEVSNLHKNTPASFTEVTARLATLPNFLSPEYLAVVERFGPALDSTIKHGKDYNFDLFGIRTLLKSYLYKVDGKTVERPQHMWMRVAVGIHGFDMDAVVETYDLLAQRVCVHATPTLYNAGTTRSQMSSCFLLQVKEDSLTGIYDTLGQCAQISKYSGGIGLAIHKVRATGANIAGTNGESSGIVPMLRVFEATSQYVNQGGKRKGSVAMYLEPWHADIYDYLFAKRPFGDDKLKATGLFYGLWIPDLFMERCKSGADWTLFSPDTAPGLETVFGEEFEALYERYEREGRGMRTVKARDLWSEFYYAQVEAGGVYLLFKDACNKKSNQKNLGTIQCSNLCTEIIQYTSKDEVAVCNLASISLPHFYSEGFFDYDELRRVAGVLTRNLNKIIDKNFYPVPEARNSNLRHRPIGVGVQGLADLFAKMHTPFDSPRAVDVNRRIFETIYYGCLEASVELAKVSGPYESYAGSPFSRGEFQFDMWGVKTPTAFWDWDMLRKEVAKHGIRNSLLTTVMPTASTAQILGNNESIEPYTSNVYTRETLAADAVITNKWLVRALDDRGLWNADVQKAIIRDGGSVQGIPEVPQDIKDVFRTVYEIKQTALIDMAADRGAFIDQSQSLNLFKKNLTHGQFTSMHWRIYEKGLKGSYYMHTNAASEAQQFTVDPTKPVAATKKEEEVCESCSA